jgi:hypothetical protein
MARKVCNTVSAERLREVLEYSPYTGLFYWRVAVARQTRIGDVVTGYSGPGRSRVMIDGVRYLAHRLAWFYMDARVAQVRD